MPNIDPRAMKSIMAKMGMKSSEIDAKRVVIEAADGSSIIIESPQVTKIEMQGAISFQVAGDVREEAKALQEEQALPIEEDDIDTVASQTGIGDRKRIRGALEKSGGDIAKAIIALKGESGA